MTDGKPFVIACIPAYNEEKTIAKVVLQTMKHVDKVVVCDDGSTDMTGEIAEQLGAEVIRHERNLGYGAALASLFRRSREIRPDVMVILDGDGQHCPEDIPRLVEPIVGGEADIAIGCRFGEGSVKGMPGYRRWGVNRITELTNIISDGRFSDAQSGFRAYGVKAFESLIPTEMGMGASVEILLKACESGLRVVEVPVKVNYDVGRPSTHNPIHHGMDVVLSLVKYYSIRHPMLVYGVPGFLALFVAVGFWVWTLQSFALTRQVITNVTLIAIGATIVGLMLLTTAIILWVLVSLLREKR